MASIPNITKDQSDKIIQLQEVYIQKQREQINLLMAWMGEFGHTQRFLREEFMTAYTNIMTAGPSSDQSLN